MNNNIDRFLKTVRKRLNRALGVRVICGTLALGVLAALVAALVYRVQGFAVPWQAYTIPIGGAAVLAVLIWMFRLRGLDDSARAADNHFGLKDSLISALHFGREGRDGEVYELQRAATESKIKSADPAALPFQLPKRAVIATVLGAGALAWMATLPASEAVQRKQAAAEQLESRTEQIAEELEEFVEELLQDLDEEEREVLNPEELKKWVRDLKATGDEKDALRQFAKLEQKINKAMAGLEARQDEAVLKLAAAELSEAEMAELRQLAKLLDAKDFKLAEQKLREMEHKEGDPRDKKNMENFKKLREAMKRMNAGANQRRFAKANGRNGKANDGKARPGNPNKQQPMAEMLGELDEMAGELMEGLADMEFGDQPLGQLQKGMKGKMGKLAGRMRKLDAKKKMRAKLGAMRQCLGQCQGFAMGECQALGLGQSQSPKPGGLKPGKGSSETRRKERDELADNGNTTKLKGQQGQGPSERTVEEADSGTGVASKTAAAKAREFRKSFESFVHRDDVPEAVKIGVREYFERIHEISLEEVDQSTPPAE